MNIIRRNVTDLKELDNTLLLNMDYKQALNKFVNDKIKFDIVFLDPPYKLNIMKDLVDFLLNNDLINILPLQKNIYTTKNDPNIKSITIYTSNFDKKNWQENYKYRTKGCL